jgi:mono/diheme cytochrome c family protein
MPVYRRLIVPVVCAGLTLVQPALAQRPSTREVPGFPDAPGKEVLVTKCFQCHSPNMWVDHRQDRRSWEATLYRMVGRGALWSEDEIAKMADYLGAVYAREPAVVGREPVKSTAPR